MNTSQHAAQAPRPEALAPPGHAGRLWPLGKRRKLLVRGFHQEGVIIWVFILAFVFLSALDFTIYRLQQARSLQILKIDPHLSRMVLGQDRGMMVAVGGGSLVALVLILCITL